MAQRIRHRRKVLMDANNHDRWIVSYADFITLLFAFFVVMYSISSVNEGKYKSLTHSLGTAFSNEDKPQRILDSAQVEPSFDAVQPALFNNFTIPLQSIPLNNLPTAEAEIGWELGGEILPEKKQAPVQAAPPDDTVVPSKSVPLDDQTPTEVEKKLELSEGILKERRQLNQASDQLEKALEPFIDDNLVSVKRNDYWVELEMNSEMLFLSGEAALSQKAQPALKKIAEVINALPNVINVEGHTDNIPIGTPEFPSNWDLSSARATSVVQELVKGGINPTRLSAIGYGEFHPIGDNKVEEGRFKNRRVTLVLMSQAFARYGANDEERAKLLNLVPTANVGHSSISKP